MATGYTRNDTTNNIANGNVINAADLDGEFDAIQAAYDVTTGHDHDGTVGGGAPIKTLGPAQDIVITTSVIRPKTDNTVDLGTSTLEFKDLFIDGTANIDSLVADTADINGGTSDGAVIGGSSAAAGTFTTATATTGNITTVNATTVDTTNIEVTNIKAKDGTASATIADTTGVMTVASAVLTTADINGGTIDGTTIGGSSAGAGTFTTATATTGNITTVNATTVDTTNIEVTTIKAKDGTSAGSIADSTGVVTLASSVLTTTDINGGTVDGAVIGGSSAAAITGTTITATTLSVNGDVTIADKIIHAGDTNTAIRFPAADTVTVETSGAERLRVDSSGNVGIGTSSPWSQMSIGTPAGGSLGYFGVKDTTHGGDIRFGKQSGVNNSAIAGTWGNNDFLFFTNSTERMRIDASGNVGIGTSSPANRLSVAGTSVSGGAVALSVQNAQVGSGTCTLNLTGTAFSFGGVGGSESLLLASDVGPLSMATFASNPIKFITNQAERARINSNGDLLVGRTSPQTGLASDTVGISLYGNATSSTQGVGIFVRNSTNHVLYVNNKTSGGALVIFYNGGNSVGEITSNGTTTSYATSSDYRLKENVQPMQDALAVIAQLNPVTYTWKADGSDGQGFIAHELQAVVPDCVSGEKDAVDAEGNPQYQGVDTSFLVATLVKAVQELKAEVDSLRAQLNP